MTHPHLEGLIALADAWERQAQDPAFPDEDERPVIEAEDAMCRLHASQLRQALAALPGGGVDEAMVKELNNALAWLRNGGNSVPAGQFLVAHEALIRRAATLPTPNPHEADRT